MYKCIIIDDDRWSRIAIRQCLPLQEFGFELSGEYDSVESALEDIRELNPDLIITDIIMKATSGLDLLAYCKKLGLYARFIMISGYDCFEYAQEALNNGALYYLLKPIDPKEARRAIQMAQNVIEKSPVQDLLPQNAFEAVLLELQTNFAGNVTLDNLAAKYGFSAGYLSELFSKKLGIGFAAYKNQLRIEKAKKLLRTGCSINEAAFCCGFEDARYFAKVFKSQTGFTPSEWRSLERQKEGDQL